MTTILAALLPNGEQQFLDANGAPYVGGLVYFYIPGTTTPKTTWKDPFQQIPNTSPVELDAAGRAIIYGTGQYRQILYTAGGVMVWDQLTDSGQGSGDSGGFGAQISVESAGTVELGAVASNNILVTGAVTVNSFGSTASEDAPIYLVEFDGALTLNYDVTFKLPGGRDILTSANDRSLWSYEGNGNWECFAYFPATGLPLLGAFGPEETIASATTTDLGSLPSNNSLVTGTVSIAALGASASLLSPVFVTRFSGALTLVHSATLVLPNNVDLHTSAGDFAMWQYLGSGAWALMFYQLAAPAVGSGMQVFTGSGNFVAPVGTTASSRFKFTVVGGGGGSNNAGAGGGSGGLGILSAQGLGAGTSCAIVIGPGGAGANASGATAGTASSATVLGTTYTAGGGGGAAGAAVGTGGTCTGFTMNSPGVSGAFGTTAGLVLPGAAAGFGTFGLGGKTAVSSAGGSGSTGIVIVEWWL